MHNYCGYCSATEQETIILNYGKVTMCAACIEFEFGRKAIKEIDHDAVSIG